MNLYKDMLVQLLSSHDVIVLFPDFKGNVNELIEMKCFQALRKIKAILEDESLEDADCFMKIEEVLCVLESLGSNGGTRHSL